MSICKKRPNIVFIISDDQGHWGSRYAGNKEIITDNLDRLAKTGVYFDDFFCVSPVCSPARLSIFTGKIPSSHGVHDWIAKGHVDYSHISDTLKEIYSRPEMSWEYEWGKNQLNNDTGINFLENHKTFTEILADNDYTCGISGKWHMGDSFTPQAGFSYWKTIALGGDNYYYPIVLKNDKMEMEHNKYITDYITENAIEFLNQNEDNENPFYLSVHYTAPHAPWDKHQHPEEVYDLYKDCEYTETPCEEPHKWSGSSYSSKEEFMELRKKWLRGYYTATTAMDIGIGEIIDKIEAMGERENTIIIFTSDNGMSMGHHGIFGKGNGTYPMNMYDSAVKVPMIVSYPTVFPQNVKNNDLYSHYDIMPTILDLLNLSEYLPKNLPGHSFSNVLNGQNDDNTNENIVIMDEYGPVRMIRNKKFKYVHRYTMNEHELYDLVNDPDEKNNLYFDEQYKEIKDTMFNNLESWFLQYSDEKYDGKTLPVCGIGQLTAVYPKDKDEKTMFNQI